MLKDVTLATQLGVKCGAPMLVANLVRGMLQTHLHDQGPDAKMDNTTPCIEKAADMKFLD